MSSVPRHDFKFQINADGLSEPAARLVSLKFCLGSSAVSLEARLLLEREQKMTLSSRASSSVYAQLEMSMNTAERVLHYFALTPEGQ